MDPKYIARAAVVAAACLLWLPNLDTIPRWDWDEGYNLNYAWNISEGRLLWFSIKYAFIPHPPLYLAVLAGLVKVFGNTIMTLRIFTVGMNFAIILLLYLIGRLIRGEWLGFLASLLFCVYPAAVYWGRQGFSNHLLSLIIVASAYCLLRFQRDGGLWWACACGLVGLSAITEPQGLAVCVTLLGYFALRQNAKSLPAALLLFGPFAAFALIMFTTSPYFVEDVSFQMERVSALKPVMFVGVLVLAIAYRSRRAIMDWTVSFVLREVEIIFGEFKHSALVAAHLITSVTMVMPISEKSLFVGGDYFWIGIIGIFFVGRASVAECSIVYMAPTLASIWAFGRSDHMIIPLYPFLSLGVAALILELHGYLKPYMRPALLTAFLAYPFMFAAYYDFGAYALGGVISQENVGDLMGAAAYVRDNAPASSYVITTTNLARFFFNATEITQAVSYEGYRIEYYHARYPRDRYVFNISYLNADYAVVPEGMIEWFRKYAPKAAEDIGSWNVVNRTGAYMVYRNPNSV